MNESKKLPKSFWILISLVLVVSIILIVGIGVENKDKISQFLAQFHFSQSRSKTFPQVSQCKILKENQISIGTKLQFDFWDSETMSLWAHSTTKVHLFKYLDQGNNQVELQQISEWSPPCSDKDCQIASFRKMNDELFLLNILDGSKGLSIPFYIQRNKSEITKAEFDSALGICGRSWGADVEFFKDTKFKDQLYALDPENKVLGIYRGLRLSAYNKLEIPISPKNSYKLDSGFLTPYQCESGINKRPFRGIHFVDNYLYIIPEAVQAGQYEMWVLGMLGDTIQGPQRIDGSQFVSGALTSVDAQNNSFVVSSESNGGKNKNNILFKLNTAKLEKITEQPDYQNLHFAQVKDNSKIVLFEQDVSDPHLLYYYVSDKRQKWLELTTLRDKKLLGEQVMVVPLGISRFQILYNQKMSQDIYFVAVDCDSALLE